MEIKYWFVLMPSVFVWKKNMCCYFYNSDTFVGKKVLLNDLKIRRLIDEIIDIDNLYCLSLNQSDLDDTNLNNLVTSLILLNMAKLIDQRSVDRIPIQLPPLLNLQSDVDKLKTGEITDLTIGENVLRNLKTVTIELKSEVNAVFFKKLTDLFVLLDRNKILEIVIEGYLSILYTNVLFLNQLASMSCVKKILITLNRDTYEFVIQFNNLFFPNVSFGIIINPDSDFTCINDILKFDHNDITIYFIFYVFSEDDYNWAKNTVLKLQISDYIIRPKYNNTNLKFFEKYVYIDEEDILDSHQTKQNIFAHQVLNTNDFGKLKIMSNGNIYANSHLEPLGTIDNDIRYLVSKEMLNGFSWRRIRNFEPCSDCIYQWLCPSPSDYELELGKNNLCYLYVRDETIL